MYRKNRKQKETLTSKIQPEVQANIKKEKNMKLKIRLTALKKIYFSLFRFKKILLNISKN